MQLHLNPPKYRFLVLQQLGPVAYDWGYYDRLTGHRVHTPDNEGTVAGGLTIMAPNASTQLYISADGFFTKSNSYICIFDRELNLIETVQLLDIVGKPYPLPTLATSIGVTLDYSETLGYPNEISVDKPIYSGFEFNPYYSKLAKKIGKENNQMFFREQLDTDLHFVGKEADYFIADNLDVEDKFMLICERWSDDVPVGWFPYHVDLFNYTDCDFNRDAHTCTPKLTPLDEYTRIMAKYSDSYDLIKLKPVISRIKTSLRPIIELYELGSSVITRFLGGTYWETEITNPIDDKDVLRQKHFERIVVNPDMGYAELNSSYYVQPNYDIITLPSGRFAYNENRHNYELQEGNNLWALEVQTVSGFGEGLVLTLNNSPYYAVRRDPPYYSPTYELIGVQPQNFSGVGDLPLDNIDDPENFGIFHIIPPEQGGGSQFLFLGTMWLIKYAIFGRVVGNTNQLLGIQAFDLPLDDFAVDSPAYKKCAPLSEKAAGFFYGSLDTSLAPTIYGIKENPDEYYTNENLPVEGGIRGVRPMPIGKYEWGTISYWYNYATEYITLEEASRYDYYLRDCFTIGSAIRALLAVIDPSIIFEETDFHSKFLYGPVDMKGGYDWRLAITPKSNVLKGDYDQPARKAPITFEELMGMLRDLYKLYWYVDEDKHLHIEHIAWFNNGGSYSGYAGSVQLDLTSDLCKDAFNKKKTAYWQDSFKFEMSEAVRRYELGFAEKGTEFFDELTIDLYNSYLNNAKVDSRSIANYTSDIDLMRIEPSKYSSDGFAVLAYLETVPSEPTELPDKYVPVIGAVEIQERDGWVRDAYINNLFASWLYCQHFLMYDISGDTMKQDLKMSLLPNDADLDVIQGFAYLKKQSVQFPFGDDPDTIDLITTQVGNGRPESFDVDALTRVVKATLSFPIKELPTS